MTDVKDHFENLGAVRSKTVSTTQIFLTFFKISINLTF